ncbi:MAG: hypothetical protein LBJ18_01830 [Rickettsiales bacterium]|jgi:ribosomal protein S27E|nr:hypothetical protein [Rickettsiales bacterium]
MKIKCEFCKTEYSVSTRPSGPVECAVCGHIQTVAAPRRRGSLLTVLASVCALLAAIVFAVVIMARDTGHTKRNHPLTATIESIRTVVDAFGEPHLVVSGRVKNQSQEIYGVPNLLFVLRDNKGAVLETQKFLPPAAILDIGESAEFSHTLSASAAGVKKVNVELETGQMANGKRQERK